MPHDKKKKEVKTHMKTLKIGISSMLLLIIGMSLISVGAVSAAEANATGASYVTSHGVIGKDVPIKPSASIDAIQTAYYYAYAENYNTGNWMSLTSYNYNGYASCSAGPGTALSCSGA